MSDTSKSIIDAFNDPIFSDQFIKSIEERIKKEAARKEMLQVYFESEKFEETFAKISKYDCVDSESIAYKTISDISSEEFYDFFDSVCIFFEQTENEESMFLTYESIYRGYKFTTMHGQGTVYIISKVQE